MKMRKYWDYPETSLIFFIEGFAKDKSCDIFLRKHEMPYHITIIF